MDKDVVVVASKPLVHLPLGDPCKVVVVASFTVNLKFSEAASVVAVEEIRPHSL